MESGQHRISTSGDSVACRRARQLCMETARHAGGTGGAASVPASKGSSENGSRVAGQFKILTLL